MIEWRRGDVDNEMATGEGVDDILRGAYVLTLRDEQLGTSSCIGQRFVLPFFFCGCLIIIIMVFEQGVWMLLEIYRRLNKSNSSH